MSQSARERMSSGETLLNKRYRLVAQQGSGGMAVIYKAVDQDLGRTVAVKILRPSLTKDPTFVTRFRNEARAVANLSHPNIVTVHDVGNDGPTHYIVMEYVEGQDLKKIIRSEGVMSVDRALKLAIQMCAGIGFAHRAGLVHADVKPQNMLVTNDDALKVTDFGIAQALTDTQPMQRQEVVWGSPHYFAPEQARGEKPTPASDVYSIGIVVFEMLTGHLPYSGANQQELAMAHLRERVPMISEFNGSVPENLSRIVFKVMSKEPSARYRMADQLGHILKSYWESSQQHTAFNPHVSRPVTPPPSLPGEHSSQGMPTGGAPVPGPSVPSPLGRSYNAPTTPAAQNLPAPPATPWPMASDTGSQRLAQSAPVQQPTDSSQYYTRPPVERGDFSSGLDVVTILLAIVAFFAVACLIPLWIAVFQAYLTG